jgi:hypothetical protein
MKLKGTAMTNLLKTLFKREEEISPEEAAAMEQANEALRLRMRHYLAQTHDKAAA